MQVNCQSVNDWCFSCLWAIYDIIKKVSNLEQSHFLNICCNAGSFRGTGSNISIHLNKQNTKKNPCTERYRQIQGQHQTLNKEQVRLINHHGNKLENTRNTKPCGAQKRLYLFIGMHSCNTSIFILKYKSSEAFARAVWQVCEPKPWRDGLCRLICI